jgi:hypothetical protein
MSFILVAKPGDHKFLFAVDPFVWTDPRRG